VKIVLRSLPGRIVFYSALGALATAAILAITGPLMGPEAPLPLPGEQQLGHGESRLQQGGPIANGVSTPEIAAALAVAASVVILVAVVAEQIAARRTHPRTRAT
jgi:hypothetical protein